MVFICTPHRGSFVAGRNIIANLIRRLLTLPFALTGVAADLARNPDACASGVSPVVPSAVDNMSPRHHFIRALQEIPVAPSITVNSIIAVEGDGPVEQGNDGVVEYASAHIEPVESELVVQVEPFHAGQSPHHRGGAPDPAETCGGAMTARTSVPSDRLLQDPQDFSLVLGGPLFQLLRRAHLSDDALMLLRQRIIVISLFAWLPLLVLSALEGQVLGGSAAVPFLLDVEVHVRFLVALPLLIVAELVVHQRMRFVVKQFLERHLIPESAMARFDAAIASAFRLRNSVLAEVLLIAFVYGVGVLIVWRQYVALDTATWYATPSVEGSKLSLAGMWYGYVSLPIFQFLLLRWYFRLFIWTRFLWQVSRIELSLVPTHPDRVGGLGFLSNTVYAFIPLAVAHGALLAGHARQPHFLPRGRAA